MNKTVAFNRVEYTMLEELANRARQKPDQYIKALIKQLYEKLK